MPCRCGRCSYHPRMSSHYETLQKAEAYPEFFKVAPPGELGERLLRARRPGYIIRAVSQAEVPAAPPAQPEATSTPASARKPAPVRELLQAQWGLVPHWVKNASDARLRAIKLLHARNETASTAQAFRDAWLNSQRCIIPIMAFFEDDYRSGKPVSTRISRVDGKPMGLAGLWARWQGPEGEDILSFAALNINANTHGLLHRYQPPGNERRMPAILNEGAYDAWLSVRQDKAREFMRQYSASWLTANPVENKKDKIPKDWRA
ncbi:SOS response-associated peptidase [Comamonas endophytica]|uniref:Abasic site processing protein n=2 Tax=Comamonas endophytica TaxID=2949090 RepID=A0ABY6G9F4_9BURK|nr:MULTISPECIES: SOS response-associated peptidase family protein [unclassified Acidovorax]UYG51650.1 SOS response-associated peptidase [Acidovorax sp. 5MLIR]